MVSFILCMITATRGISRIRRTEDWNVSMYEIKLVCEWCGYQSEFMTLSDENVFPLGRGRYANMKTKCGSCTRTGHITIHDLKMQDGSLLLLDFDGLQPLDGALRCRSASRATDVRGRFSTLFMLMVDPGMLKSPSGDPISRRIPAFNVDATYPRDVSNVDVFFKRA